MASPILLLAWQTYWPLSEALAALSSRRRPWSVSEDDFTDEPSRLDQFILTDGLQHQSTAELLPVLPGALVAVW